MPRGGAAGGRGGKRSKKGQRRHFTSAEELQAQAEHERKQKEWRKKQGIESDEEEDEDAAQAAQAAKRDLPPTDSTSEEESSDDEGSKAKGVSHLIDIENPNRVASKSNKKISELQDSGPNLSRREREELEKQRATERYKQLHLQGKTEEARSDLARLTIIRQQRAEAAKKREVEKAKEAKSKK